MMNNADIPDAADLAERLVALRDALVDTAQSLRELQYRIDLEGQKQAGDTLEQMLERFVLKPAAGDAEAASAPSAG